MQGPERAPASQVENLERERESLTGGGSVGGEMARYMGLFKRRS